MSGPERSDPPAPPPEGRTLHVLLLEDSLLDAALVQARLEEEGLRVELERVDTRQAFTTALARARHDLILCDYNVPGFGGLEALAAAREARPDTPFLFVSGALGEDTAIELLKRGATDYVLKDRLERLVPSIERALREAHGDAVRKQAEESLRQSEERYRLATLATSNAIWDWDLVTQAVHWNEAITDLFGYAPEEVGPDASWWYDTIHPEDRERVVHGIHTVIDAGGQHWRDHYRFRQRSGAYTHVVDRGHVSRDATGRPVRMVGAMQDVTAQREAEEARSIQSRHSQLMASVGLALTRATTVHDMLQRCTEALVHHLDAAFAQVWLLEQAPDTLLLEASSGRPLARPLPLGRAPLSHSKVGHVAREFRPHLTNELPTDPHVGNPEWVHLEQLVSFAGSPLLVADQLLGVVAVLARQPMPQATLDTLQQAADSIALGVERLRAQEETARLFEREKAARATAEVAWGIG